jgi:ubiquinone/menaquinone biosynthesis C-methylase UbiE
MFPLTDPSYLQNIQYKTSANLGARASLHVRFRTNPEGWMRWAFDQLDLRVGMRLLEVGGGPGWLWRENRDRLPPGLRLTLSDFSPGMAREARSALVGAAHFVFVNLDAQAAPFPAACFDLVIANHMLYHVPDLPRAVRELARLLKKDGRLCAATNGVRHMQELDRLAREFDLRCAPEVKPEMSFRLENAAEALRRDFARVEIRRYPDALWVTEARPLADYVYSGWRGHIGILTPERRGELEKFIQSKIDADGGVGITKDVGMAIGYLE